MKITTINIIFFLLFCSSSLIAQNKINNPYSRFGLGELHGKNINTQLMGMGGLSLAVAEPTLLNPANPASFGAIDSSSFIIEISFNGYVQTLKTITDAERSSNMTLNYLFLGFPISKWWKTSLGMMPFSKIGYNVKLTIELPYFSNIVNSIEGDGGLNQFYWGNAFKVGKNLRLGIDGAYLFGNGSRSSLVYYPDSIYIRSTKITSNTKGSDFIFDYGLQYDFHLNESEFLTIGAVYANKFEIKSTRNSAGYTLIGGYGDLTEEIKDTIYYNPDDKGLILLPQRFGVGLTYQKKDRLIVGADFEWQEWDKFKAFNEIDSLDNAWKIAVGGQYTPKNTSLSGFFTHVSYRLGVNYYKSYINLLDHRLDGYAMNFGFGFPLKNSKTGIDLAFEFGKYGTTQDNLMQINYFNFSIGLSIFESWFYKRKYN